MRRLGRGHTSPSRVLVNVRIVRGVLVLAFGIAASGAFTATPAARADELSDAKAQAKALERRMAEQQALIARLRTAQVDVRRSIVATKAELAAVAADLASVRARVDTIAREIEKVRRAHEALLAELVSLELEIDRIEREEATKRAELRNREQLLAERIRVAYEAERTSFLEVLVSAASFSDVLAEMSYQLDVAAEDREIAEAIQRDRATLAALRENAEATRRQTNLVRQETEVQQALLDRRVKELREAEERLAEMERRAARALAAQRAAFAQLTRNRAQAERALARADTARDRLRARIDRLVADRARRGSIPSQFSGTFAWPMPGTISQDFGCTGFGWEPTIGDCRGFHQGIDIVAAYGTPVRAAAAGEVVYVGWNYADGADPAWIVVIAHSSSLETWYAHLQPVAPDGLRPGARVAAGQVIGYEGNTGRSTGAHLHWAVRRNGVFVNPRVFL